MKIKPKILLGFCLMLCATLMAFAAFRTPSSTGLSPASPVTITLWHYYNGSSKEAFDKLVDSFNSTEGKRHGVTVHAFSQGDVQRLAQAIFDSATRAIGSNPMPDIFATYPDTAFRIAGLVPLVDLARYFSPDELAEFRPEFLVDGMFCAIRATDGESTSNCGLHILPIGKSTEVLFLNKTDWDLFASGTGATLDNLSTWEGLTNTARDYYEWTDSLTPEKGDGKGFFRFDSPTNFVTALAIQQDATPFQSPDSRPTDNVPALANRPLPSRIDRELALAIWTLYHVPFVEGHYSRQGRFCTDDARTGSVIAYVASSAGAAYFPDVVTRADGTTYTIENMILPYPHLEQGGPAAFRQGAGMSVTKSDPQYEQAAVLFLKWFTGPEQNTSFAASTGYLPVRNSSLQKNVLHDAAKRTFGAGASPVAAAAAATALDMATQGILHADSPSEKTFALRVFWDAFLPAQVTKSHHAMRDMQDKGMTRAEALRVLLSEESFERWYNELRQGLEDTLATDAPRL